MPGTIEHADGPMLRSSLFASFVVMFLSWSLMRMCAALRMCALPGTDRSIPGRDALCDAYF